MTFLDGISISGFAEDVLEYEYLNKMIMILTLLFPGLFGLVFHPGYLVERYQ